MKLMPKTNITTETSVSEATEISEKNANIIDQNIEGLNQTIKDLEEKSAKCRKLKQELKKSYDKIIKEMNNNMKTKNSNKKSGNYFDVEKLSELYKAIIPSNQFSKENELKFNIYHQAITTSTKKVDASQEINITPEIDTMKNGGIY